ncbi:hypothetical protein [Dyella mobilis]|uniref:EscI/YscI/HrpB family type III secretion system inner rod protein n=1 Tax=Dyella mobilis TaxID=1849582 RepID=A0ABS2KBE2_9GAMM|nr:hypothetical protein [Dyella mobilis]MBM7128496.1 hypothetical protein [Dyella mobilis]GLQ99603.1 hypothetical protein GCM10007863_40230 [Dyella mobilis]
MDLGNVMPALMPDASAAIQTQFSSAQWASMERATTFSKPLAAIDEAMTVGREQGFNSLLERLSKGDMSPGQFMVAQFEFTKLTICTQEITNLSKSIKDSFDKLQQS